MNEDTYARLHVPAEDAARVDNPAKVARLRELEGQVVAIPRDSLFWFHERDDYTTISPLRGPQDEGVFYTVPRAWLHGQDLKTVQDLGHWLSETFWERSEYREAL